MTKRRKAMTLAEDHAQLKRQGRYDAMVEAKAPARRGDRGQVGGVASSADAVGRGAARGGFAVDSAWDLVNTSTPYPAALPILLEHLERPYPDRVRKGIAWALAVRDARFGAEKLISLYREEQPGTDRRVAWPSRSAKRLMTTLSTM